MTNLYKTAVTDQTNTRQLGYQDAVEDLLAYLDKEGLGLQEGPGRKIRQWATSKIDGVDGGGNAMESDEDRVDTDKRERRSSSGSPPRTSHDEIAMHDQPATEHTVQPSDRVPAPPRKEETCPPNSDRPPAFTFCAAQPLPNLDVTTQLAESSPSSNQPFNSPFIETSSSPISPPVRVEVLNRNTRLQNRHMNSRHGARNSARDAGLITGTKRKLHLAEFFDISSIGNVRDGVGGGGKRGRHA